MTLAKLLDQARPLSFIAQGFIALNVVESYFEKIGFKHPSVDTFFQHLWELPMINEPKEFSAWEARRGDLTDFGLTDDLPDELEECLAILPIDEAQLFKVVEAPVEILWGSFFSTPNPETTMAYLEFALTLAEKEGIIFPKVAPFQSSLWSDNNGWGNAIDAEVCQQWREA